MKALVLVLLFEILQKGFCAGGRKCRVIDFGVDFDERDRVIEVFFNRSEQGGVRVWIDLHLLFPADTPIERAHREATEIEAAIKDEVAVPVTITTHLESIEEHEEVHQELSQGAE